MKRKASLRKEKGVNWEKVSEQTRQRCNGLSEQERRRYRAEALRIIYSTDAETTTRRG
jgi:hypothetical protein